MGSVGPQEIIAILLVAVLLFGPKRLPEIGRTLGKALREFRKATNEFKSSIEDLGSDDEPSESARKG